MDRICVKGETISLCLFSKEVCFLYFRHCHILPVVGAEAGGGYSVLKITGENFIFVSNQDLKNIYVGILCFESEVFNFLFSNFSFKID